MTTGVHKHSHRLCCSAWICRKMCARSLAHFFIVCNQRIWSFNFACLKENHCQYSGAACVRMYVCLFVWWDFRLGFSHRFDKPNLIYVKKESPWRARTHTHAYTNHIFICFHSIFCPNFMLFSQFKFIRSSSCRSHILLFIPHRMKITQTFLSLSLSLW